MVIKDLIDLPPSFPLRITESEGVSPSFQRLHWHATLEINYICQGTGHYLINGNKHELQEGDIVLINSNDLHRAFEQENLIMRIIMFDGAYFSLERRYDTDLMNPFREMGRRFQNVLDRSHPVHPQLRRLIQEMSGEYTRGEAHFETIVRAQMVQFFALVNRHFARASAEGIPHTNGTEHIRSLLRELENRLSEPWTLREMADYVHLSPSRFSALFTQVVGTSPIDYLIQLRLTQAIAMLESSDYKIIEIAECCGFHNLSNFNRLFRRHIGKSPSEVRPLNKQ
ncbi:AraC family transcriptional regulator [Paenibacillus sp. GCM10012307]|uniref:Helix-turn-helix domain-containing protein n=1 Tax=Paenibacillus roseus TaxID=2798579 RepID=A0A934J7Z4_9BACL|nr:AraC family transcriptional regulator [Paenibacillus roseus]MBJ6361963.1 helix-turn-helix domain-containing protein [Paenibacillus roseus]